MAVFGFDRFGFSPHVYKPLNYYLFPGVVFGNTENPLVHLVDSERGAACCLSVFVRAFPIVRKATSDMSHLATTTIFGSNKRSVWR